MTHPLPPDGPRPPGWIAIQEVSNGCGGGEASTEPGLQNWIGDSATFGDGLLTDPRITVNFREACNLHDAAYSGALVWDSIKGDYVDFRGTTRKEADDKLQTDMDALCDAQIESRWTVTRENCKAGIAHWILVRATGWTFYRERTTLNGDWTNSNPGWPMCDTSLRNPWQIHQSGRTVVAVWQEEQGTTTIVGRFKGTLITGDTVKDDRVVGTYTLETKGPSPKVTTPRPMTLTMTSDDSFNFTHDGATMTRSTQSLTSGGRLPSCSLTSKPTQTSPAASPAPVEPTRLTLTVNGTTGVATKTATLAQTHPTAPQVAPNSQLTIKAVVDGPLPTGWKLIVFHNGDPKSQGNGNYYKVCEIDGSAGTTQTSCGDARPTLPSPGDDFVGAQVLSPTGLVFYIQVYIPVRQ